MVIEEKNILERLILSMTIAVIAIGMKLVIMDAQVKDSEESMENIFFVMLEKKYLSILPKR